MTAQSADRSSCSRSGGKLSRRHQPTLRPVKYAYVCVHGAICGAACMCEDTSVSLQVECVHVCVCVLVRLFSALSMVVVEPTATRPAPLPPRSTQPLTRYLKYLTVEQQSIERQPWNQCHTSETWERSTVATGHRG